MNSVIFITGTRRSGTTLLFQALSGSTELWCRNELHEVHRLLFSGIKGLDELDRSLDRAALASVSRPQSEVTDLSEWFSARMKETALQAGKARWCLKDPEISQYLESYATSFPAAKFIIMIRDPRAVARSFLERGTSCNWYSAGERWANEVAEQLDFQRRRPSRALLLKYEDLVKRLPEELGRVCDFVGIPMEESLVRYHERDSGIRIHEGNQNVRRPPDPSINDKWRTSLNERQLACLESAAAEVMAQLGYQPESRALGPGDATKWLYRLHNRLVWEYRWQRASRCYGIRRRVGQLLGKSATFDLSHSHGKFR